MASMQLSLLVLPRETTPESTVNNVLLLSACLS